MESLNLRCFVFSEYDLDDWSVTYELRADEKLAALRIRYMININS